MAFTRKSGTDEKAEDQAAAHFDYSFHQLGEARLRMGYATTFDVAEERTDVHENNVCSG